MTSVPTPPAPQTVSEYMETMDALTARTQRICEDQPHQQAVRTALLRAEKDVHFTEGWDCHPRVFMLNRHAKTGRMSYVVVDTWSRALTALPMRTADVLLMLATAADITRVVAAFPEAERSEAQREACRDLGIGPAPLAATEDLTTKLPPNVTFHGLGLLCEAYGVFGNGNVADDKAADALAAEHRLFTHPARVEMRQVHFYDRHGCWWEVTRHRRSPGLDLPRYCVIHDRPFDFIAGDVPHALSRVCNAIAGNSVDILSR